MQDSKTRQEEQTQQAEAAPSEQAAEQEKSKTPKWIKRNPRIPRVLVAVFVVALMCFSLAFHFGLGSPSSYGIGSFSLLCPLGGLESLLASRTFIPRALISFLIVLVVCLVVGRAWCGWICPAPLTRRIFGRKEARPEVHNCKKSLRETFKTDSRLWVLIGILVASLIIGLPIFCLVCPIGLTFGTVMSIWRLFQFSDLNWGLLIFPAALIVEMVVYRKWCIKICPIAGLLSLVGRLARPLRPKVNEGTCLQCAGDDCHICLDTCPMAIDLHAEDATSQLADCTRCMECRAACPTSSITMPLLPKSKKTKEKTAAAQR